MFHLKVLKQAGTGEWLLVGMTLLKFFCAPSHLRRLMGLLGQLTPFFN